MRDSVLNRRLKDIDIFKRLPKNLTRGSILGVIMTVICVLTVVVLLVNEFIQFYTHEVESGMRIDHRKDDQHVEVHISIDMHKFPCNLLGLDVSDFIGTHVLGDHENLVYTTLDTEGNEVGVVNMDDTPENTKKNFYEAFEKGYGCRIQGFFNVLLVPGNFHIGFHSKDKIVYDVLTEKGPFEVDFTHTFKHLYFGATKNHAVIHDLMQDFNLKSVATLTNFDSRSISPSPGPFSFQYKLLIVPTDLIYEDGQEYDIFQYKSFWNVAMFEPTINYLINVNYDLSSLSMVEKRKPKYLSEFLIRILGILGGMIAFMSFLHNLLQKSVIRILIKAGIGKME